MVEVMVKVKDNHDHSGGNDKKIICIEFAVSVSLKMLGILIPGDVMTDGVFSTAKR